MLVDCFVEAPQEWPRKPISALAEIDPSYELEVGREYPFLEMASVQEGFGGISKFDTRVWDRSGLCRFAENDIILGKITPCAENGKAALVKGLPDKYGIGSTEFFVLSALEGVDPDFLFSLVTAGPFHRRLISRMEGSTGRLRITRDTLKKWLAVPLPDLIEQHRIAAALKLADDAIIIAKAELEAMRELKRSLICSLFADGLSQPQGLHRSKWITCPANWKIKPLNQVAKVTSGFTMGRNLSRHDTVTVPYVTVVNVQDGRFELRDISSIEIKEEELNTHLLQHGDILMTEGGDRDKLGRGGMWREEIAPCTYQNHIFRVRLDAEEYKPELFHFLIQTYQTKNYFYAHAKQTSNLCTINSRELKNWPVPIPPMPEQKKMIGALEAAEKQEKAVSEKVEALQQVKKSLLKNLLTGKIRIPAAID